MDVAQRLQEKFDTWLEAVKACAETSVDQVRVNEDRAFDIWLGNRIEPEDAYQILIYNDE